MSSSLADLVNNVGITGRAAQSSTTMWILLILAVSTCPVDDRYRSTVLVEYNRFVDRQEPSTLPINSGISRRDTAITGSPIRKITTDGLSSIQQYVVGIAYRIVLLFFPGHHGDTLDITIKIGAPNGRVAGMANYTNNEITLYPSAIPDNDGMLLVLVHELFHLFGFGPLSTPGTPSFRDRVDPMTLVYEVLDTGVVVTTDPGMSHWNQPYKLDIMQPVIVFGQSTIDPATIMAIAASRPGWDVNICTVPNDCVTIARPFCQKISKIIGSVCTAGPGTTKTTRNSINRERFISVLGGLGIFFGLLLTCRKKKKKRRV